MSHMISTVTGTEFTKFLHDVAGSPPLLMRSFLWYILNRCRTLVHRMKVVSIRDLFLYRLLIYKFRSASIVSRQTKTGCIKGHGHCFWIYEMLLIDKLLFCHRGWVLCRWLSVFHHLFVLHYRRQRWSVVMESTRNLLFKLWKTSFVGGLYVNKRTIKQSYVDVWQASCRHKRMHFTEFIRLHWCGQRHNGTR